MIMNKRKENKGLGAKLLFFIIWPFGGFLYSLIRPQSRSSRIIFYLWFVVFGLCLMPVNEEADSFEYAQNFEASKNMSSHVYQRQINSFFSDSFESGVKDVYMLTSIYVVGKVTDNVHVLFMLLAMVFGFFYVKSMKYALNSEGQARSDLIFFILFGWFCISNPIFNINGARFWTAAWMGVYILFRYLTSKDYKILLLLPLLYLIHASFVLFIVFFIIYFLLGRYHKIWNVIFIVSLYFSGLSFLPFISDYVMNYLPKNLQFMFQYYSSEEYLAYRAERLSTLSIYAQIFRDLPKVVINIVAAFCILKRHDIEKSECSNRTLEFTIVLLSLANIFSVIPSIGRFLNLVIPFIVYILISNAHILNRYKWIVYFIPVMYTYPIYLWLLNMSSVTLFSTYFMPLPILLYRFLFV